MKYKERGFQVLKKLEIGILAVFIVIMAGIHIKSAVQALGRGPYWMPKGYDGPTSFETNMQRWEAEGISAYLRDVLGEDADLDEYLSELELYCDKWEMRFIYGGDFTPGHVHDIESINRIVQRVLPEESNSMSIWDWLHKDWQAGKAE